jgi:hypothetical protein
MDDAFYATELLDHFLVVAAALEGISVPDCLAKLQVQTSYLLFPEGEFEHLPFPDQKPNVPLLLFLCPVVALSLASAPLFHVFVINLILRVVHHLSGSGLVHGGAWWWRVAMSDRKC